MITRFELFTVMHHLESWPKDATFEEILNQLKYDDEGSIRIWNIYEEYTNEAICTLMREMKNNLIIFFGEKK